MGRPTLYTDELADKICMAVALGASVREIGDDDSMPAAPTIWGWIALRPDFSLKWDRAKRAQMAFFSENILEIADDGTNDTIETEKGDIPNREWIERSKLRVETRKWVMSKFDRRKFGDKTEVEHSGAVATVVTLEEYEDRLSKAKSNQNAGA